MSNTPKEQALEKIIPRLKEGAMHSDTFITKQGLEPIKRKVDHIIQDLSSIIKRSGTSTSIVLNDLKNIREQLEYYQNAVLQIRKEYVAYTYALETLYHEYNRPEKKREVELSNNHHKRSPSSDKGLISDDMYGRIYNTLREKGVTTFNTGTAETIGVSQMSLSRFIRAGVKRGEIKKVGKNQYEFNGLLNQDQSN